MSTLSQYLNVSEDVIEAIKATPEDKIDMLNPTQLIFTLAIMPGKDD